MINDRGVLHSSLLLYEADDAPEATTVINMHLIFCLPFSTTSQANVCNPCMENNIYGYIMDIMEVSL